MEKPVKIIGTVLFNEFIKDLPDKEKEEINDLINKQINTRWSSQTLLIGSKELILEFNKKLKQIVKIKNNDHKH